MNRIIARSRKMLSEARREIRSMVRQDYAYELAHARFFSRLVLWFRIERETRRKLKERFPPGALYSAHVTK